MTIDGIGIRRHADIEPGSEVEVRTRFTGEWAVGFEVVAVLDAGVEVRRCRDEAVLPVLFEAEDVKICQRP